MNKQIVQEAIDEFMPLIRSLCSKINVPGYEKGDILQEAILAILEFVNENEEIPEPGVAYTLINRHFYRLIRNNVTFDGCSDETKKLRRAIKSPISSTIGKAGTDEEIDIFCFWENTQSENPADFVARVNILDKFRKILTPTEKKVFDLLMIGYSKPREICVAMHGEHSLLGSKTISNHSIKIKKKFVDFWLENTGKVL